MIFSSFKAQKSCLRVITINHRIVDTNQDSERILSLKTHPPLPFPSARLSPPTREKRAEKGHGGGYIFGSVIISVG
jgi:hypothetical protein